MRLRGWLAAVVAALILGVVSTIADLIWFHAKIAHTVLAGFVHGGLLFLVMGVVLAGAWQTARAKKWSPVAALFIGLFAAGSFYLLYPLVGWGSMFAAWFLLWPLFAWLRRWVVHCREPCWLTLIRGAAAGLGSGFAFYMVRWLWTDPPASGPVVWTFVPAWTFAFLPGMLALILRGQPAKMSSLEGGL